MLKCRAGTWFFLIQKYETQLFCSSFKVRMLPIFCQDSKQTHVFRAIRYWLQIKWVVVCSMIISMKISWNCRGKDKLQVKWYVWYKSQPQTGGLQPIVVTLTEKTKERMNDLTPSSIYLQLIYIAPLCFTLPTKSWKEHPQK